MNENSSGFPKNFLWGAATSAHQVEGGNYNNWTVWELENAKALAKSAGYKLRDLPIWPDIKDQATRPENYVSERSIDHYNRYEEDFDIVKKMNLNAFRFSIEWSRIEPDEGVWNVTEIDHYKQYIKAMKRRGIEPVMTLYHWTAPVWFAQKGGFEKSRNIEYFVRFAEKVLEELGHEVRFVVTANEPDTVAGMGYYNQEHPPAEHSAWKMIRVYVNHIRAHKRIYVVGKARSRRFKIGFVKNYSQIIAGDDKRLSKFMVGLHLLVVDKLTKWYVGGKQDFVGVNFYHTDVWRGKNLSMGVNHDVKYPEPVSDLGWTMHPENLEYVLKRLGKYRKPILVLETGVADMHDAYRRDWINKTIVAVQRARKSGVNVLGYFYWSVFDNFEWAYGRWPRFGLIGIDYDNNLRRVPRKSAAYYAMIVKKMRGV